MNYNCPYWDNKDLLLLTLFVGGWWEVKEFESIVGNVAIEMSDMRYVSAMDNGGFTLGDKISKGEGPDPVEILTAIKINDTKIALKSGYGKYLGVDTDGKLIGKAEAVGSREQFEPVFQDGKMAINGCNGRFVSVTKDGDIICSSKTAGDTEMIKIRSSISLERDPLEDIPKEERGTLKESEIKYVKKFQSYKNNKLRINENSVGELIKARQTGKLHESLLDRREKMKADRYCK
ncbi:hypothetical protein LOTGIDRAFT_104723 [Lottia gigantea]|uniref:Protein FRG1 homolog n=1 Tax=Lottia gigantea TaxID=225164 RepID=V4AA71_LOTGI|nr:hypothetical protein LOTGIDRAFT_104723 [Lottia gigantea]ESO93667.1 hypothetical protein LOTGIDRAFT_104723 [Lottia gigantea]